MRYVNTHTKPQCQQRNTQSQVAARKPRDIIAH